MMHAWHLLISSTRQAISNKLLSIATWFTRGILCALIIFFLLVLFITRLQLLSLSIVMFFNELVELLTCVFTWCDSCKTMICALLEMKKLFGSSLSLLSVMETWRMLGRWVACPLLDQFCYLAIIIFIYMWSDLSLRKKGTLIVQSATTWLPLRFVQTLMLLFYLSLFLSYAFFSIFQLKPNYADAWSNLASAYMRKGRLSEATQCCQQALSLNPLLVIFKFIILLSWLKKQVLLTW